MKTTHPFGNGLALLVVLTMACPLMGTAQTAAGNDPALPPTGAELNWPRLYTNDVLTIAIHQPQIEKWEGENLESRSAVAITSMDANVPVYGVIWLHARTEVDKAASIVTLSDINVTRVKFPSVPGKEAEYLALIRSHIPTVVRNMSLDHLQSSYAISEAVKKSRSVPVKDDPPRVIYTSRPALLVLVDGPPALRPISAVPGVQRVINTRALIVLSDGVYFLFALDHWYRANAVEGPWVQAANIPAELDAAKQAAVAANTVDLISSGTNTVTTTPAIYVSTTPAELVQTDGVASLVPVEGTELMEVRNSDSAVFLNVADQSYYLLISGRWFKARTLEGPWTFESYKNLPADFARIPPEHPKANVLVSVPGTPQAEEAVIANSIPQTATVNRNEAKLQVTYDGAARFQRIEGTPLSYAINSPTPVIQVDRKTYYSVENGVWFVATSPDGPWAVATSVPAVIYSIPSSSPIHYVTYVRTYSATPDYVYVGYTPGYLGTVVCRDYVVVYGTGWYYQPYIGTAWVGWPCTYGFGAGFACGWSTGFGFGFSAGYPLGVWCQPWWGPFGWGWGHHHHYSHVSINHVSIYNHWGGTVVRPRHDYGFNSWQGGRWSHSWSSRFNPYSSRVPMSERPGRYHAYDGNFQARPQIPRVTPPPSQHVTRPQQTIPRASTVPAPHQQATAPNAPRAPGQPRPPRSTPTVPRLQNIPGGAPMAQPPNNLYGDRKGNVYRYSPSADAWQHRSGSQWQSVPPNRGPQLNRDAYGRNLGQQRFDAQRSYGNGFNRPRGQGDQKR